MSIDDRHVASNIDLSRDYEQQCVLFKSELLQPGRHTLRIECCGQRGALSDDQTLAVYGLLVLALPQEYGHSEL